MISICIPVFNYSITALVETLIEQVTPLEISYELLIIDDASTDKASARSNEKLSALKYVTYQVLDKNSGRSAVRNLLVERAQYPFLLFLDADVLPLQSTFLATYITAITPETQIVYGGITYQKYKPEKSKLLRWVYGRKREALSAIERRKKPHLRFLTLNYLINKETALQLQFDESMPNQRHEDTVYAHEAKKQKCRVEHIENVVEHQGLESSDVFLEKSIASARSLAHLIGSNKLNAKEIKLSQAAMYLQKCALDHLFVSIIQKLDHLFKKQLLSAQPSLIIFDLYRLYWYLKECKNISIVKKGI